MVKITITEIKSHHTITHLETITKALNKSNTTCDSIILLRDFDAQMEEIQITEFLNMYDLKNLLKPKNIF